MALSPAAERLLLHAACADSYHDFSHPPKPFSNTFNPIRERVAGKPGLYDVRAGLPTNLDLPLSRSIANQYNPDVLHKENQMLQELFKGSEPIGNYKVPNPLEEDKRFVKNLCLAIDGSPANSNKKKQLTRTFETLNGSETYTIKLLSDANGNTNVNDIQSLQAATSGKHAGREFKESKITVGDLYKLFGSTDVNLVFDACSMNITSLFKNAQPDPQVGEFHVNWLINREFLNDPATKPMIDDKKIIIKAPGQMFFNFMVESDPNPITYIRYETGSTSDILQRNKFFSNLDLKLGPVMYKDNKSNPTTVLELYQNNNERLYIIPEPSLQNQIGQCCQLIWEAIFGKNHIVTSSHFQRKRSGDWLQALSCLDVGRLYFNRNDETRKAESLKNKNIVLVTHDRILLWYALMLGLDVLFAGGKGLEEVGGEDDDDASDEEAASPGSGLPKLYLMYFSNNKRTLSKADIDAANIETAKRLLPKVEPLSADVGRFNSNLTIIEAERAKNIELKFQQIVQAGGSGKSKIVDLFLEFVRYGALDYKPASMGEILKARDEFSRLADGTPEKLSSALLFISLFNNLRLRMDTLSSIDAIKSSDNFARDSQLLKNGGLPLLYDKYDRDISRSRDADAATARLKTEQMAVINLATLITGALDVDKLRQLRTYIDGSIWSGNKYLVDASLSTINKMIGPEAGSSNLNIITSAIIAKLNDDLPDKAVIKAVIDVAIEGIVATNVEPDLHMAPIQDPELKFVAANFIEIPVADPVDKARENAEKKDAVKKAAYEAKLGLVNLTKKALDEATETLRLKKGSFNLTEFIRLQKRGKGRKKWDGVGEDVSEETIFQGLLDVRDSIPEDEEKINALDVVYNQALTDAEAAKPVVFVPAPLPLRRSMRQRISNFFSVGPTLRSWANKALKFFSLSGGGGDKDFWARLLFVSYMNELINAVNGFDSFDNLDYKYFHGLMRLVLSHLDTLDKKNLDYKNLIQFLYKGIPDGEWASRDEFSAFVSIAGEHIALKAIDLMDGEIPDFGYQIQNYDATVVRYGVYINVCGKLTDENSKRLLVSRSANYVRSLPVPNSERNFSNEPDAFFQTVRNMPAEDLKRLIADSKLTKGELDSFLKAYRRAMFKGPGSVVNFSNTRNTIKAGIMGGGRKRKRSLKRK